MQEEAPDMLLEPKQVSDTVASEEAKSDHNPPPEETKITLPQNDEPLVGRGIAAALAIA